MMAEPTGTRAGGAAGGALRGLVLTPVRQFQVLGIASFAFLSWMFFAIRWTGTASLRGDHAGAGADAPPDGLGERWYSCYVLALEWGSIPVMFALLAVGAALVVHSLVEAWREPVDEGGRLPVDLGLGTDRYVPPGFVIVGSFVIGVVTFGASGLGPPAGFGPFERYSVVQWAGYAWGALLLATAVGGVARAVRRRRVRRRWEGTPEARQAQAARRAAAERLLAGRERSFVEAAGAQRSGRGDQLSEAEREKIGAGADGWAIGALLGGMFGLGPVGLVAGVVALRRGGTSMWVGALGLVLGAVQTLLIVGALVAAVVTG